MDEKREDLGPLLVEQFRQQMNNLSAAIQLLTPVVREKAGPQYDPYLAILHQSLYRLIRMVGNLEYLELPEGELPLREGTLDLAGLCRELGEQVSPLTALAGIRFSYEEEIGSLLTHGDGAQLRRLLLNPDRQRRPRGGRGRRVRPAPGPPGRAGGPHRVGQRTGFSPGNR
ncbi:MAG: sensor histidine kinase [Flavonifractor plautii]